MKRFFSAHLSALALLLFAGVNAQAGLINPDTIAWTYNFSPGAPAVTADGNPGAGISFTNEPTKNAVGSSDIVASNLRVFSASTAASPDHLTVNGAYSLTLVISTVDNSVLKSGTLTFTGRLNGTFSKDNANVKNIFGPNSTQTLTLGSYTFTVSLVTYTPPGPPDQSNAGSISAHVEVSGTSPEPNQLPEPSTMLLSGLGLTFLSGAAWRKRRAKVAA